MMGCCHKILGCPLLATVVAGAILTVTGCGKPARPTGSAGRARPGLPGYAYPQRPPLVDRRSAASFLSQLGSDPTLLWVLSRIGDQEAASAAALSDARDALRAHGMRVIGLYAGPPSQWRPTLVTMLRQAGVNFPCLVVAPPATAGVAAWLTGSPRQLECGLYVLDRSQRVLARCGPGPDEVAEMLTELTDGTPAAASRPSVGQSFRARVRLMELTTGRITAWATADAGDPMVLAGELARQLTSATRPTGTVAVLPIRAVEMPPSAADAAASLAELLAQCLLHQGWPSVSGAESTATALIALNLTAFQVEFDPYRLAQRVPWEAILVGSIEYQGRRDQ